MKRIGNRWLNPTDEYLFTHAHSFYSVTNPNQGGSPDSRDIKSRWLRSEMTSAFTFNERQNYVWEKSVLVSDVTTVHTRCCSQSEQFSY